MCKASGKQQGVSLIETLIAILLVSLGLVGLMQLNIFSIGGSQSAYYRSQAAIQASDILDRLKANAALASAGSYDLAFSAQTPSGSGVAAQDLMSLRTHLADVLPEGSAAVDCTSTAGHCLVQIRWDDSRADGGSGVQEVRLAMRL